MDRNPLSEVLNTIRVKDTMASMDDRPRFKRVFGTDIDPEYSRDNEWKELMSRQKIKQRLKAARDRRKSKLLDMEKKLASDHEVAEGSLPPESVKRGSNKAELLAEYNSMKGKSVNLKPSPEHQEDKILSKINTDSMLKEPENHHFSPQEKENENDEKSRHIAAQPASPEDNSRATIVVSAIIENKMTDMDENKHNSRYSNSIEGAGYTPEVNEENDNNKETGDVHQDSSDGSEELEERKEYTAGDIEEETKEKSKPLPKQRKKKIKQKKKVKAKPTTKEKTVNMKLTNQKEKKGDLNAINEDVNEPNENEQTSSHENNKKASTKWKKSAMKVLPWNDMCSKLRQRIEEENEKQMDFLETIRILRGISKNEFYKDIELDSADSETEQLLKEDPDPVPESQSPPPPHSQTPPSPIKESENKTEVEETSKDEELTKEDTFTTEVKPELPVVVIEKKDEELEHKPQKKGIVSRIDTRWPVGHKFHTKPAEQKYLSFYLKPIHHKLSKNKINIHTLPRTAKEITEYLQWREKLLEIAYLNEFSHLRKFSLLSFAMPLPGIDQDSFSPHPVQSKKRSLSQSTSRSSIHNEQKITFQQQSYIAFNKRNGTDHTSTPRSQHKNKEKKKTRNKDNECLNPYLTSHSFRKKKHNHHCKKEKISDKGEQDQGIHYASPVENELETLMSRMNEDSKRSRNDTGVKSQSTDSAINEPSYNSDDYESDVIRTHTRNSSVGKDQGKEDLGDRIPKEQELSRKEKSTSQHKKAST
ncbi:golgin subfamily A member 6-like protein 22 [Saccostrea echinata]|uniref:golgin subfamily A member 6-like protein 22 n=1 Tax=Saccostrea echinata TaxID=191078 RepID=UPI002A8151C9|nr:golgin subfamily A member 6-like protein 22 [Saccostrea echinata]